MADSQEEKQKSKKRPALAQKKSPAANKDQLKRTKKKQALAETKETSPARTGDHKKTAGVKQPSRVKKVFIDESVLTAPGPVEQTKTGSSVLKKRLLWWLSNILIIGGIIAMLVPVGLNGYSYYSQWRLKRTWEDKVDELTKKAKLPRDKQNTLRLPEDPGAELTKLNGIAYLVIPRLSLRVVVIEGSSYRDLIKGPGHLKGTVLPGEKGNCVISGHRTMYGAPFGDLDRLTQGADVLLYTKDHIFHYVVSETKIVPPDDLSVIANTDDARLTLTTCHPKFSDRKRLIVSARLVEKVK